MGKTILVTGKEGFLGNKISQHFLDQGYRVAASIPPRKDTFPSVEEEGRLFVFPWSRRSAVAAKNFVLQTLQELETLDEAWIIVTPEPDSFGLAEMAPLALDENLDGGIKGLLYLVRELLLRQVTQPSLVLRFVFFDEDPSNLPPLAALHYHGLKALVTALLAQARKRHLTVWAYETMIPRIEEYVAYLLTSKTTLPSRWNVWGGKKSLMNSLFTKKENP